jgi:carboxyl-terminal processing protease
MSQRLRALVLVPFLFIALSIQPAMRILEPEAADADTIAAEMNLGDALPPSSSALIPPLPEVEPTLIPYTRKIVEEPSLEENFTAMFPPEPVFAQVVVQETPVSEIQIVETQVVETLTVETSFIEPPVVSEQDKKLQVEIFSDLWITVNDVYLYPDFNGLDWLETRRQVREKIEAGLTFEEFYREMENVVRSLGDDHSFFLTPEKVAAQEAKFSGNMNFAGIGVISKPVADKGRSVILLTFPGGPADLAGLKARDSILAVDGIPILNENGLARDLIRGPEGSQIMLTVQSPGEEIRQVPVTRAKISGPIPIPTSVLISDEGKRIGYMLLVSFADSTVETRIGEALASMAAGGALDGLILDNRYNEGGADRVLKGALSYFTDGLLGHFVSRKSQSIFEVTGVDVAGSQQLPMVVIVGPATVSFGEIFSGILQDNGRAVLLGEPTKGNVETLSGHNFRDGSRAWIAYKSFRPANNPDLDWEQVGVVPDWVTPLEWEAHHLENDPTVLAALQYLDHGHFLSFHQ